MIDYIVQDVVVNIVSGVVLGALAILACKSKYVIKQIKSIIIACNEKGEDENV